ncbi:MAG TPA: FKBP-type peptidyl-prolyl cis-trans isomerase [Planctomycetaceae bacterium]|nr:FKBP-type peptidyl-prolyl cis-trans isomerase [Planctomycetaceae bacterium]
MQLRSNWRAGCGMLLLLALGCTNTGSQEDSPVAKAPALPAPKATAQSEPGPSDPDAPEEFTTTPSGLKYRVLRKSDGRKPKPTDRVLVNYEGKLDNGTVFDSSYARREPIAFGLNQVIPGWTEGMQHVGEGGKIELEIPGKLGYGAAGSPPKIPPNATLHFIVELIEIK